MKYIKNKIISLFFGFLLLLSTHSERVVFAVPVPDDEEKTFSKLNSFTLYDNLDNNHSIFIAAHRSHSSHSSHRSHSSHSSHRSHSSHYSSTTTPSYSYSRPVRTVTTTTKTTTTPTVSSPASQLPIAMALKSTIQVQGVPSMSSESFTKALIEGLSPWIRIVKEVDGYTPILSEEARSLISGVSDQAILAGTVTATKDTIVGSIALYNTQTESITMVVKSGDTIDMLLQAIINGILIELKIDH